MGYDKGHKEFHALDLNHGWHTPPGYPPGIQQKIIAGELDENRQAGQPHAPAAVRAWHLHDRAVRARILGGSIPGVGRPDRRQRQAGQAAARSSRVTPTRCGRRASITVRSSPTPAASCWRRTSTRTKHEPDAKPRAAPRGRARRRSRCAIAPTRRSSAGSTASNYAPGAYINEAQISRDTQASDARPSIRRSTG